MAQAAFETFREPRGLPRWMPYGVAVLLALAFAWFVYQQLNAVRGVKVEAPSPQIVSMLPPPPPPPPPPVPKEKPPEPTEQPQPSPVEAPKPQQQQPQAAPVTIAAPAQAGSDAFGVSAGTGGGTGAPSSTGTCLGTNCGPARGGGIGLGFYRSYLSSALQQRVSGDERLNRLAFSADLLLTVDAQGRVTGARLIEARGRDDDATMRRLAEVLRSALLDPPPPAMAFPYKITVRGRRPL